MAVQTAWAADITQNTAVVINKGNKAKYNNKNITGIGHRAFEGCTALKTLNINSGSTLHIGRMAFAGCPALTTINFYCGDFDSFF